MKWLVTAGPTVEAIDPVRFLSNHSTGRMGYAIAAELAARGAEVVLVSGPTALETPAVGDAAKAAGGSVWRVDVVSAEDMWLVCSELWPRMDGAVMCAAVADYTPVSVSPTKIKKPADERVAGNSENIFLELRPTRDIAAELGRTKRADQILVGFALETDDEEAGAIGKLERKNLDLIVLNSLRDAGAGFGGDTNKITIFSRVGRHSGAQAVGRGGELGGELGDRQTVERTDFPLETKSAAAAHIVDHIARI